MKVLFSAASGIFVATALLAVTAPAIACHSVGNEREPKLEIFSNQQPILIGRNQAKNVTVLGAVYDGNINGGTVSIVPNGPAACPIFVNGVNSGISIRGNSTNVPFLLAVRPAGTHPIGTFQCTLTYFASQINLVSNQPCSIPTTENQVSFQYTVKNKFVF